MKQLVGIFGVFLFCGIGVCEETAEGAVRTTPSKEFTFSDQVGGCDDALLGRWFLHFEREGTIKIGLWSDDGERRLKYRLDDERAPNVFVDDIFSGNPKWRRVDEGTLEISNDEGTFLFRVTPHFFRESPDAEGSKLTATTEWVKFTEMEGEKREFVIGFVPRYRGKFEASRQFR